MPKHCGAPTPVPPPGLTLNPRLGPHLILMKSRQDARGMSPCFFQQRPHQSPPVRDVTQQLHLFVSWWNPRPRTSMEKIFLARTHKECSPASYLTSFDLVYFDLISSSPSTHTAEFPSCPSICRAKRLPNARVMSSFGYSVLKCLVCQKAVISDIAFSLCIF